MYDVVVIGGGPAGMAAAISAHDAHSKVLLLEREPRLGGILKQCIHDGFGLERFHETLTGPEYAERYIQMILDRSIPVLLSSFLSHVEARNEGFLLTVINREQGVDFIECRALVLANGCRERTSRQIFLSGNRPSGILTAGTAQHLVNIEGYLPCERCVILGSGDIGLIMARRLTLEGAEVLGVFEVKKTPSGLPRNISQCLEDFSIPLYLEKTVVRVFGDHRVEGVEIADVDEVGNPIPGSESFLACDGIILSVGLIPENEIAESLGVAMNPETGGPYVDAQSMTSIPGVFSCGNGLHVFDLVDAVSDSGKAAGEAAAAFASGIIPLLKTSCVLCPRSCIITAGEKDGIPSFFGNGCDRGIRYMQEELINPSRTLTTTIRTRNPSHPRLSVKTSGPIPRSRIRDAMVVINKYIAPTSVKSGDVLIPLLLGMDVALVATESLLPKKEDNGGSL